MLLKNKGFLEVTKEDVDLLKEAMEILMGWSSIDDLTYFATEDLLKHYKKFFKRVKKCLEEGKHED